jgi:hypothetical protein
MEDSTSGFHSKKPLWNDVAVFSSIAMRGIALLVRCGYLLQALGEGGFMDDESLLDLGAELLEPLNISLTLGSMAPKTVFYLRV